MNENVCNDNRFNLIAKYKAKLIEATNIETSQDEMAVIDNILFRMWQMGWLDKLDAASPWHRVEDGLPEEDVDVLISYRYKEGEGDTSHVDIDITSYGQMYFGGREVAGVKHWRPPFEYFSSNYEVIAWMPLPEPPKEDA